MDIKILGLRYSIVNMSFIRFYEKLGLNPFAQLLKYINRLPIENLTILDLGAGSGYYWKTGKLGEPVSDKIVKVTCLDIAYDKKNSENLNYIQGSVPSSLFSFSENSFDIVIAFDLVEHLTKSDGYLTLYEMQRICSHACIVFTPNGFSWQPPSDNNKFNAHISSYTSHDFNNFRFNHIYGMISLKRLIGPYSLPRNDTTRLRREIIALFGLIVFKLPKMSYSLFAVFLKTKSDKRLKNQEL